MKNNEYDSKRGDNKIFSATPNKAMINNSLQRAADVFFLRFRKFDGSVLPILRIKTKPERVLSAKFFLNSTYLKNFLVFIFYINIIIE